jgi:hypothetical protein
MSVFNDWLVEWDSVQHAACKFVSLERTLLGSLEPLPTNQPDEKQKKPYQNCTRQGP